MPTYFVYILCSKPYGTLYVGVTNDIARRLQEHKNKALAGFTSEYNVDKLAYVEEHQYIHDALEREKDLKRYRRAMKIQLIEQANPEWKDLYYHLL